MEQVEELFKEYGLRLFFSEETKNKIKEEPWPANCHAARFLEICHYAGAEIQVNDVNKFYEKFDISIDHLSIKPIVEDNLLIVFNRTFSKSDGDYYQVDMWHRETERSYKMKLMESLALNPEKYGLDRKKIGFLSMFDQPEVVLSKEGDKLISSFSDFYKRPSAAVSLRLQDLAIGIYEVAFGKDLCKSWIANTLHIEDETSG